MVRIEAKVVYQGLNWCASAQDTYKAMDAMKNE